MQSRKRSCPDDLQNEEKRTPPPYDVNSYPMMMDPMYHSTPQMTIDNQMLMRNFPNSCFGDFSPIGTSFSSDTSNRSNDSGIGTSPTSANSSINHSRPFGFFNDGEVPMPYPMDVMTYPKQEDREGEARVLQQLKPQNPQDPTASSSTFASVPGRLSLMGNGGKYDVSVAEIHRRIAPPECLNSSSVAALLRKAKTANNGQSLREELAKAEIVLPLGRRKQGSTTACTALLEGEALHLANDVSMLTQKYYPLQEIQDHLITEGLHNGINLESQRQEMIAALNFVRKLRVLVHDVQSPVCDQNPMPFHNESLQTAMDNYSAYTHGFGLINQRTWVSVIEHLLVNMLGSTSGQAPLPFGIPPPPPHQMGFIQNFHPM